MRVNLPILVAEKEGLSNAGKALISTTDDLPEIQPTAIPWRRKRLRPRPKVTIAIGLISKKGIVLASDSQTTYAGGPKSFDSQKITILKFLNAEILVAQAGMAELADKAVEIMQRKATGREIEAPESVYETATEAVREIRNHFWELNHLSDFSENECRQFFLDHEFNLLCGFFCKGQPHLFTINLSWCIPVSVKGRYRGVGIGADLGEYLIREYAINDPEFEYAYLIAGSVVQRVIDNIDGCGLPLWIGITYPVQAEILAAMKNSGRPMRESLSKLIERREINMLLEEIKAVHDHERAMSHDLFRLMLERLDERRRKMFGIEDLPSGPK